MKTNDDLEKELMAIDPVKTTLLNLTGEIMAKRYRIDMSIEELANKTNISAKHIKDMEEGLIDPDFETVAKLAYVLDMKVVLAENN
ncbi:helix-turn-helix transcriptional regulator [Bacillus bombysepticus]|uniref:helix-turn-helix domain-containing protein n=1 Tax=Bacillus bombysepticus TaxID=658666 RepID=UPI003015BA4D